MISIVVCVIIGCLAVIMSIIVLVAPANVPLALYDEFVHIIGLQDLGAVAVPAGGLLMLLTIIIDTWFYFVLAQYRRFVKVIEPILA